MTKLININQNQIKSGQFSEILFSQQYKLQSCLKKLETSKDFIEIAEREFEEMIGSISNISERTEEAFNGLCTLNFSELCYGLMHLIDLEQQEFQQGIMALKIFRKIIEKENTKFSTPAADWETENYIGFLIFYIFFFFFF